VIRETPLTDSLLSLGLQQKIKIGSVRPDGDPALESGGAMPRKKGSAGECREGRLYGPPPAKVGSGSEAREGVSDRRAQEQPGSVGGQRADGQQQDSFRNVSGDAALMPSL
jgi:hypothetical protein